MQVLNFSDFSRRRGVVGKPVEEPMAAPVIVDRWAALHAEAPVSAPVVEFPSPDGDFWTNLQLRIAYPTLHMRHH